MKMLGAVEARAWCLRNQIAIGDDGLPSPVPAGWHNARFEVPQVVERTLWFSRYVSELLKPRDQCILWISTWGVWPSSENWHLYYRVRESYGDRQLIEDASAHLFLPHEENELVSFLQIAVSAGWDGFVIPCRGYARAFFSHDGWVEFATSDVVELEKIDAHLRRR